CNQMLEFQCWNAGGKQSQTFSLCSLPHSSLTKEDMFAAVGEVLAAAAGVLYICCDNAGEHVYVKSFLLGLELPLHQEKLRALPFWRDEQLLFLAAPAHVQKNWACQVRAWSRNMRFGRLCIDNATILELGCPPGPFTGLDPQSDREAALLANPYFLVADPVCPQVPWSLYGFLALNVTCGLIQAALLHGTMSTEDRCVNALSGYVLLDLCQMRQSAAAAEEGQAAEASFLHSVTVRNLQELAASAVLHCLAKPVPFKRSRLSELKVEMWFSLLQRQFANSQMTARSY
ncbi:ubiB, partial [Symbiodinium microadriaticum]